MGPDLQIDLDDGITHEILVIALVICVIVKASYARYTCCNTWATYRANEYMLTPYWDM